MSYTTLAQDIITAVTQDSQVQTTNSANLLNYVNRVSMRMLRESQWIFLRSEWQYFMTEPDAFAYWIGDGTAPAGCVQTNLQLGDIYGVLPDSVYDLTNARQLTQDSPQVLVGYNLRFRDAQFRAAHPRTYNYDFNTYGILNLFPPPDNNNIYEPIPSSPICNYTVGGSIPISRNYYVLVTLVDTQGGESVPCYQYSNVVVPANHLLTVDSPTLEVAAANLVAYAYYNVYVGLSAEGAFYLQNSSPIAEGTKWTELTVSTSPVAPTSFLLVDSSNQTWAVSVTTQGLIQTTRQFFNANPPSIYITDAENYSWLLYADTNGQLHTTKNFLAPAAPALIVADSSNQNWIIGVTVNGQLTTQTTGTFPATNPPQTSTISPLYGYVIGFQYQKKRIPITTPSDTLQIPDQYADVVIAGVNYYVCMYTSKADDVGIKAAAWKKEFMDGLAQMRRDLRINFRNTDAIMPDPTTQYQIGTQAGYSFYAV